MGNPFLLSLPLLSVFCGGKGIYSEVLQQRDLRVKEQLLNCVHHPPYPRFSLMETLQQNCIPSYSFCLKSCHCQLVPVIHHQGSHIFE